MPDRFSKFNDFLIKFIVNGPPLEMFNTYKTALNSNVLNWLGFFFLHKKKKKIN